MVHQPKYGQPLSLTGGKRNVAEKNYLCPGSIGSVPDGICHRLPVLGHPAEPASFRPGGEFFRPGPGGFFQSGRRSGPADEFCVGRSAAGGTGFSGSRSCRFPAGAGTAGSGGHPGDPGGGAGRKHRHRDLYRRTAGQRNLRQQHRHCHPAAGFIHPGFLGSRAAFPAFLHPLSDGDPAGNRDFSAFGLG